MSRRRPRYSAHPDANQPEIVKQLRQAHFLVLNVSSFLPTPDIFVWGWDERFQCKRWGAYEIKTETGKLTDKQHAFMEKWLGAVVEARSAEDVLRDYGQIV